MHSLTVMIRNRIGIVPAIRRLRGRDRRIRQQLAPVERRRQPRDHPVLHR